MRVRVRVRVRVGDARHTETQVHVGRRYEHLDEAARARVDHVEGAAVEAGTRHCTRPLQPPPSPCVRVRARARARVRVLAVGALARLLAHDARLEG